MKAKKSIHELRAELTKLQAHVQDCEAFDSGPQASDGSLDLAWANRRVAVLEVTRDLETAIAQYRLIDPEVDRLRCWVENEVLAARDAFRMAESEIPPVQPIQSTAIADLENHIANQEAHQTAIDSIAAARRSAGVRLSRVFAAADAAIALLTSERQAADMPTPKHCLYEQTASGAKMMAVPNSVVSCDLLLAAFGDQRKAPEANGMSRIEIQIEDLRRAIKKKESKVADARLNDELWATDEELCRAAGHRGMTPAQYKREVRDAP